MAEWTHSMSIPRKRSSTSYKRNFERVKKTFEAKGIDPEELLMMDIDRLTEGLTESAAGVRYNSTIQSMVKRIRDIKDIGRYSYRIVIMANAKGVTKQKLQQLTSGFPAELIDAQACYEQLMYPLIAGTYYTPNNCN